MEKKENKLVELSMDFAVEIVKLTKYLKEKKESVISNQIARSGTSIGANISEAQYAQDKSDFVSKLKIALKEANETIYWLELLLRTEYINKAVFDELYALCNQIKVILIKSCTTAKNNG